MTETLQPNLETTHLPMQTLEFSQRRLAITVDGTLPSIGTRTFTGKKGGKHEITVLAELSQDDGNSVVISSAGEGRVACIVVEGDQQIVEAYVLNDGQPRLIQNLNETKDVLEVTHDIDGKGEHWIFSVGSLDPTMRLTLAKDKSIRPVRRRNNYQYRRAERKDKGYNFVKRVAGLALAFAALAPNGPLDWGIDALSGVDGVVASATRLDMVSDSESQNRIEAVDKVRTILHDIDDGNIEAVQQQGEAFANDPSNFLPKSTILQTEQNIAAATSTDEIIKAMNGMTFCTGVIFETGAVGFAEPTIEEMKYTSQEVLNVLAKTPLAITTSSSTKKVVMTGAMKGMSTYRGGNSGGEMVIVAATKESDQKRALMYKMFVDPFGPDMFVARTFRHEFFGHGLRDSVGAEIAPTDEMGVMIIRQLGALALGLLNYLPSVSIYGLDDTRESAAESMASTLNPRSGGYANPNDGRKFLSGANGLVVANLIALETRCPGIAAYLITKG